jgi:methionyl-tRNA formyltransferase
MTRIVFMGSPEFAVPTLRMLVGRSEDIFYPQNGFPDGVNHGATPIQEGNTCLYEVVGVVTQPDRPSGRGREVKAPPIKTFAVELGLTIIQPEKLRLPEAMDHIRLWAPDLIVVAAFGQILRPDVLALPPQGCINVHASLLPRWRGAAPIQAAVMAGDVETGVTIMKMDQGVDTGGIISQRAIPIEAVDTGGSLIGKLSLLGAQLLSETLPRYLSGELQPQVQDNSRATYAPMLKKEDGRLDFTHTGDELARRVRALNPRPGAFFEWNGELLKVHRAHAEKADASPGKRLIYEGQAGIGTGNGLLILDEIQPAGKKSMTGRAFLTGARGWTSG